MLHWFGNQWLFLTSSHTRRENHSIHATAPTCPLHRLPAYVPVYAGGAAGPVRDAHEEARRREAVHPHALLLRVAVQLPRGQAARHVRAGLEVRQQRGDLRAPRGPLIRDQLCLPRRAYARWSYMLLLLGINTVGQLQHSTKHHI